MFVDLSDVLTPHRLANVIHEAAYRGRYVEAAIRDVMARSSGRHNLAVLERAMELHRMGSAGTKSGAEDAFLRLERPEPLVNMHLLGRVVDFHWPEHRVAVEVDGIHGRPWNVADDAGRDEALAAAGYAVLRFRDREVHQHLARSVLEFARRWRPAQAFGVRLEDAVHEPALGRRDEELLEQQVAARIVVDHPALDEQQLEHAVAVAERGDRRR
jgi:hypothetical protein